MERVFLNDKLVDIDKASVPVTDAGFLYGAGVFETMRAQNGVVFALNDHLDRLFLSASRLSIVNTYDKKSIIEAIQMLLKANKLKNARLRITLTAGVMSAPEQLQKPTLLITAAKLQPYPARYYNRGALTVLSPYRQNTAEPTYGHKTTSYFPRMLALQVAQQKKAAEAIWFTVDNRLAEGCVSNVFLVKDSTLLTPPVNTPVLAGVARKTVCHLAVNNAIELHEKNLFIHDILEADEIFLTNVIMKVLPVIQFEKHVVKDGKPGEVTKKLIKEFDKYIKIQCQR